ncbi:MAG: hypothetical protein JWQ36_1632 [Enterovirga sp.]|jgi:hypothetical protein|nr:hypothetical protein [Enterovirga sp.]
MRSLEYPLARARRVRATRPALGPYSLLLCAALAFIFMGSDDGRRQGSPPTATLEVAPAQAMAPSPRRVVAVPADRVLAVPAAVSGGTQAPDIWSTPLAAAEPEADQPEPAMPEAAGALTEAPALPPPSLLFEQTSLIEQPVAINGAPPRAAAPAAPAPGAPLSLKSLAGRWAPHPAACPGGTKRTAYVPLTLDERGARTGEASCAFRRTEQDGSRWHIAATCTDANESWNANVRLALAGTELTWSSGRGTQTYSRCP